MDAVDFQRALSKREIPAPLVATTAAFAALLATADFEQLVRLRHQVTHKRYRRGVYGTTESPAQPAPLAFPQQMDIELGDRMAPIDEAARWSVAFADSQRFAKSAVNWRASAPHSCRSACWTTAATSGTMRYLNRVYLEMCRSLTTYVQHDRSDLAKAVRQALAERHLNAETSAVADFCPESASLAAGESVELHHLVIVDHEAHAFVGMLHRTATSAHFGQWRDVPSTPIAERNAIVRRIN
jgi:hypothetical protein